MAYNYMNGVGNGVQPPKTPQQLQAELMTMLQGQYAPIYSMYQQNVQSPIPNQPCTSGIYDQVKNYQEVENYPTPTNGTAVLLFNFEQGVFYSKKFVNGQSVIQPFTFMPLNSNGNTEQSQPTEQPQQSTEDKILSLLQNLSDRVSQLENSKPKKTKQVTEVSDEV